MANNFAGTAVVLVVGGGGGEGGLFVHDKGGNLSMYLSISTSRGSCLVSILNQREKKGLEREREIFFF